MSKSISRESGCKINLLLNILGKRPDGFHDLETIFFPVKVYDTLTIEETKTGIALTCSNPSLPCDATNLVHRSAAAFLEASKLRCGVKIHLEKRIPMAAGLGGGSGNAAATLLGLNDLFGRPRAKDQLHQIAAQLGSDVPFFLENTPTLGMGRGEKLQSLGTLPALEGKWLLLIHPGFGISTAWAYKSLAKFPEALNGRPGRAQNIAKLLQRNDFAAAQPEFYNSLEAPALHKYPLLRVMQEFLRARGVLATLMSGSGSTTFAIVEHEAQGAELASQVRTEFGNCWTALSAC